MHFWGQVPQFSCGHNVLARGKMGKCIDLNTATSVLLWKQHNQHNLEFFFCTLFLVSNWDLNRFHSRFWMESPQHSCVRSLVGNMQSDKQHNSCFKCHRISCPACNACNPLQKVCKTWFDATKARVCSSRGECAAGAQQWHSSILAKHFTAQGVLIRRDMELAATFI